MGCSASSVARERNRDAEQGWHKNESDDHNDTTQHIAELQGTPIATEMEPVRSVPELPATSQATAPRPELDGSSSSATPQQPTVYELESPIAQRDGETLPPPYSSPPPIVRSTDTSTQSPISPMTDIDTESPTDRKPVL
jgi:hypothetical protein